MGFEAAILAALARLTVAIGLRFMWISHRIPRAHRNRPTATDPITGSRDRVAIYDLGGPFIPMPAHLRSADEMVAWMTKELPKLTAGISKPRA